MWTFYFATVLDDWANRNHLNILFLFFEDMKKVSIDLLYFKNNLSCFKFEPMINYGDQIWIHQRRAFFHPQRTNGRLEESLQSGSEPTHRRVDCKEFRGNRLEICHRTRPIKLTTRPDESKVKNDKDNPNIV